MDETSIMGLGSLVSGCGYVVNLLYLLGAVIALVRLRATGAGLLIGGGLVVMSMCGLGSKMYRSLVFVSQVEGVNASFEDIDAAMNQMTAFTMGSGCISAVCWLAVGIGILLIPKALAPASPPQGGGLPSASG